MATKIDDAVAWAVAIANDSSHGYDQTKRWGPDYDCSSLLITAWQTVGVPVKTKGATYTGNMLNAFLSCGFKDVTKDIKLSTGDGLEKGDVLLNTKHHTAMCIGGGQIVHASINENGGATGGQTGDQTGKEICTRSYYNYPWNYVLRFPGGSSAGIPEVSKDDLIVSNAYLSRDEIIHNATYICARLLEKGWTLNAACGVLGNMARESHCNPGLWESLIEGNMSGGFGLTQWTPASKIIDWCNANGYDYLDVDVQLQRISEEMEGNHDQYYPTTAYPETGQEFIHSTKDPEYLASAFMKNWERPGVEAESERREWAKFFFEYFSNFTPSISTGKRKGLSLIMMYLATRR